MFLSAYVTVTKIDHIINHKMNFNKSKGTEIILWPNGNNLEVNNKKVSR